MDLNIIVTRIELFEKELNEVKAVRERVEAAAYKAGTADIEGIGGDYGIICNALDLKIRELSDKLRQAHTEYDRAVNGEQDLLSELIK